MEPTGETNGPSDLAQAFIALTRALQRREVEYLLVGGMAVNFHGLVRATEDIDIFVRPTAENVRRLKAALRDVWDDPCIEEITVEDLAGDYPVVRYGPPTGDFVVDLMARVGELFSFDDLEGSVFDRDGVSIHVATPLTLYRMKRDTVRYHDKADAQVLKEKFGLEDE